MSVEMFTLCAVHGVSVGRAACDLSASVRRSWKAAVKRRGDTNLVIVATMADEPEHSAACASAGGDEHIRMVRRCLKSSIRSGKLRRTKELKQREKP